MVLKCGITRYALANLIHFSSMQWRVVVAQPASNLINLNIVVFQKQAHLLVLIRLPFIPPPFMPLHQYYAG